MGGEGPLGRHPGTELAQDLLDGDPGAADDRLAQHHGGIDRDAIVVASMTDHWRTVADRRVRYHAVA